MHELTGTILKQVLARMEYDRDLRDEDVRRLIEEELFVLQQTVYLPAGQKSVLMRDIFDRLRRLGPLQVLLEDPEISEIMVNGADHVFIERHGMIEETEGFESEEMLEDIIQRIVANVNRTANEMNPIVDARLPDGSRVHVVLPPVAIGGAVLTIRKFPKTVMTMERLLELGTITEEMGIYLKKAVEEGKNMIVSGGTSSGKTSFLNALSGWIPEKERVIVIEDSAELQLTNIRNLVNLEEKMPNTEGRGAVTAADLIKASLRMRPDRIIVGEVRDGAAAVDLLTALNTGHIGQSTIHSNSAEDTLSRIETLVLVGSGNIPLTAVRRQIQSAVQIIVHLKRMADGSRRVSEIVELDGLEKGEFRLKRIFAEEGDAV